MILQKQNGESNARHTCCCLPLWYVLTLPVMQHISTISTTCSTHPSQMGMIATHTCMFFVCLWNITHHIYNDSSPPLAVHFLCSVFRSNCQASM